MGEGGIGASCRRPGPTTLPYPHGGPPCPLPPHGDPVGRTTTLQPPCAGRSDARCRQQRTAEQGRPETQTIEVIDQASSGAPLTQEPIDKGKAEDKENQGETKDVR